MDIALAFDLAFARYAMVTIDSVAEHGRSAAEPVHWWLMPAADIPESTVDTIVAWAARSGAANVLRMPAELDSLPLSSWRGKAKPWQASFPDGEVKALYQQRLSSVPLLGPVPAPGPALESVAAAGPSTVR